MLASAQKASIHVVDEDNVAVVGATLYDQVDKIIGFTDFDGLLEVDLTCDQEKFTISYFGYVDHLLTLSCLKEHNIRIALEPDVINLKTINIVGQTSEAQKTTFQVDVIDKKAIQQFQSQTSVEALEQQGGAYIQRSQMGGGSPILRGFEANKVLLVIDGVRMNNAIYRSGHLQNAITVDQAILNNITTLYGPGSILYGSDALGGVIHFETLRPRFSSAEKPTISGGYYVRTATANSEGSGHFHLNAAGKNLASLTSITYSDFGDLRAGKNYSEDYPDFGKRIFYVNPETDEIIQNADVELQRFTKYQQLDALQKFTYKFTDKKYLGLNIQYSTTSDIPRYDELTEVDTDGDPLNSEWYYGPQKRYLAALRYDQQTSAKLLDRLQFQAAYQRIHEDRHQRTFQSPDLISNLETVDVYSLNADLFKKIGRKKNQEILYGMEYRFNRVNSEATRENIETNEISKDVFTRYPSDRSNMHDAGIYGLYQLKKEKYTIQLGGRINYNNLNVRYSRDDFFVWPEFFYTGISQKSISATWLAGFNYNISPQTNWRLFTGTAFRAPNVDDFGKIRVRSGRNISIPNAGLTPENTWNIETGLQHAFHRTKDVFPQINIGATIFYTKIKDAIVRQNFALPSGETTYTYLGRELDVQAKVNANRGFIVGTSFQVDARLTKALSIKGALNWQRGRADQDEETMPLAHIPPIYGHTTMTYERGRFQASMKYLFNGMKDAEDFALGSSDNLELATPEGSLAWSTLNIYASLKAHDLLRFKVGVENLSDRHYRTFSSGLSAPGRNFKVGVYGSF